MMQQHLPLALAFLLGLAGGAIASAAEGTAPAAVLVGDESIPVRLKAAEPDAAYRFETASGERTIAVGELVRWGNPIEATSGRLIVLGDGSQLTAVEWVVRPREEPLLLEDSALTFTPSLFEPVTLARHLVRGIVLQLPADRAQRDRLLQQVGSYAENDDAVLLTGGDRLTGHVVTVNGEGISLGTSLGQVQVPLSGVTAVLLGSLPSKPAADSSSRVLTGLSDGSLLAVREMVGEGDKVQLKLRGDVVLKGASAEDVVSLQPLLSEVTYLSDVEPHRYVHVPYLDLSWPLGKDRNVLGGRLRAGGRLFPKGLGVHSAARLIYRLDGSHRRFEALAAIDDSAGRGGSAIFRVLLAQGNAWREAYTSQVIRGGEESVPVSVPLEDAKGLALVVDYADRGDELDHADWLDARLE